MLEDNVIKPNTTTIVSPATPVHPPSLWKHTIIFSIILWAVIAFYYFVNGQIMNVSMANRAIADVSIILIGLSFVLSSVCYFWNFADHLIVYRKQLGVVGFVYAVIHTLVIILYLDPIFQNWAYYLEQPNFTSYSLALAALFMYGGMVIISAKNIIHKIGGKLWRELLRVGYLAYIFSLIHFILLTYPSWLRWLTDRQTILPPFGILTALFGILVILMRVMLMIHKLTHKPFPNAETNNPQTL